MGRPDLRFPEEELASVALRKQRDPVILAFDRPINALEIGTWMGVGSTAIWLEHLLPGSTLALIDPWRRYASGADLADIKWDYSAMDAQVMDAYLSTIAQVRRFEIDHPGRVEINILRGDSVMLCGMMQDEVFDFIYIDGDHKYASVSANLRDARRLCHDGGVICGDDSEFLPVDPCLPIARQHLDRKFLREPHLFHLGLLAPIADEVGMVNVQGGFWWTFKRGRMLRLSR